MNQALIDLGDYIAGAAANEVERSEFVSGELILWTRPASLIRLMTLLRDDSNCQFKVLVSVCGADYPAREQRFEVVYNLLSLKHNQRIRVKIAVREDEMVPSTSRAASGPPSNTNSRAGSDSPRSQVGMRKPRMRAAATLTAGIAQKGRQSRSHLVSRGMSGTEPRIRKLWEVPSLPSS